LAASVGASEVVLSTFYQTPKGTERKRFVHYISEWDRAGHERMPVVDGEDKYIFTDIDTDREYMCRIVSIGGVLMLSLDSDYDEEHILTILSDDPAIKTNMYLIETSRDCLMNLEESKAFFRDTSHHEMDMEDIVGSFLEEENVNIDYTDDPDPDMSRKVMEYDNGEISQLMFNVPDDLDDIFPDDEDDLFNDFSEIIHREVNNTKEYRKELEYFEEIEEPLSVSTSTCSSISRAQISILTSRGELETLTLEAMKLKLGLQGIITKRYFLITSMLELDPDIVTTEFEKKIGTVRIIKDSDEQSAFSRITASLNQLDSFNQTRSRSILRHLIKSSDIWPAIKRTMDLSDKESEAHESFSPIHSLASISTPSKSPGENEEIDSAPQDRNVRIREMLRKQDEEEAARIKMMENQRQKEREQRMIENERWRIRNLEFEAKKEMQKKEDLMRRTCDLPKPKEKEEFVGSLLKKKPKKLIAGIEVEAPVIDRSSFIKTKTRKNRDIEIPKPKPRVDTRQPRNTTQVPINPVFSHVENAEMKRAAQSVDVIRLNLPAPKTDMGLMAESFIKKHGKTKDVSSIFRQYCRDELKYSNNDMKLLFRNSGLYQEKMLDFFYKECGYNILQMKARKGDAICIRICDWFGYKY